MRRMLVAAAVLALAGCGPGFEGTFEGLLSSRVVCGSAADTAPFAASWRLDDNGRAITITPDVDPCVNYTAIPDGATADVRRQSCPSYSGGGFHYYPDVTSGTITVDGDDLDVEMLFTIRFTGSGVAAGAYCTDTWTGTLHRDT